MRIDTSHPFEVEANETSNEAIAPTSRGILEQLEIFTGSIATGLTSAIVLIPSLAIIYLQILSRESIQKKIGVVGICVVLLVAESISMVFIFRCLQKPRGTALLDLARRQISWPVVFRPVVAVWWIGHFITLALFAETVTRGMQLLSETSQQRFAIVAIEYLIYVGASFGSNGYLLLATGAISRESPMVRFIFRARFIIDLLTALVFIYFPFRIKW